MAFIYLLLLMKSCGLSLEPWLGYGARLAGWLDTADHYHGHPRDAAGLLEGMRQLLSSITMSSRNTTLCFSSSGALQSAL
jgi:hypothetical protein